MTRSRQINAVQLYISDTYTVLIHSNGGHIWLVIRKNDVFFIIRQETRHAGWLRWACMTAGDLQTHDGVRSGSNNACRKANNWSLPAAGHWPLAIGLASIHLARQRIYSSEKSKLKNTEAYLYACDRTDMTGHFFGLPPNPYWIIIYMLQAMARLHAACSVAVWWVSPRYLRLQNNVVLLAATTS